MEKDYQKLIATLSPLVPEAGLTGRIIARVRVLEVRKARRTAALFGVGALASLSVLVYSGVYLYGAFTQSGFYDYLSLLFSGDSAVLAYWKDLTLTLVESAPLMGLTIALAAFVFLIWTGANAFSNLRRVAPQYA